MISYQFRKYQPLSLRLWHWLNALVILGLLGTVLLRKTFLSWRTNSALIQEKLQNAGTTISADLAKEIAVAIRNPLWDWHIYLGVALTILLVGRILIALLVEKSCPLAHAFKSAMGIGKLPTAEQAHARHYTLVRISYALLYLVTAVMVATGLILNFKNNFEISKDFASATKEIHEVAMWFFVVFIIGHIGGVVMAENRGESGLISDMINGGNPQSK